MTAGVGFGFTVTAEDAEGNVATGFTGSETVAIANNAGGSTLGGTVTVSATNGVASFSGLTLNKVGSGYTLAVTSGTLTAATSSAISVTAGTATQLLITAQPPATVAAGSEFFVDNVLVSGTSGTFTLSFGGQTTPVLLFNTTPAQVQSEVQALSGLSSALVSGSAGNYTITNPSSLAALTAAGSGGATPIVTVTGTGLAFVVTAEDAEGNVATGFTGSETVAIANNAGGSTLGGTVTVSATNGVASFSGLTLNKVGSGYTLAVTSGTLTAATSSAISVTPGTATQLLITAQPPATVAAGSEFFVDNVLVSGTSGTFTLSFGGQTTPVLLFNATPAQVQSEVQALSGLSSARWSAAPQAITPSPIPHPSPP